MKLIPATPEQHARFMRMVEATQQQYNALPPRSQAFKELNGKRKTFMEANGFVVAYGKPLSVKEGSSIMEWGN